MPDRPIIDLKRLRVRNGDILVIREFDYDDQHRAEILDKLASIMVAKNVAVFFVERLSDMRALDEERMNKLGWCRCSR